MCRYKSRSHEPLNGRDRWAAAIYLGRDRQHGQHILYDNIAETICYARTVLRVPNADKFDSSKVAAVKVNPWSLHVPKQPDVVFRDQVEKREEAAEAPTRNARRVYIKPADIAQFGYTSGCPKCEHEMKYGAGRCTIAHSETCRRRIMEELAKTPEGQARIARAVERIDRTTAELGEQWRADIPQPAAQGEKVEAADSVRAQVGSSIDV